MSSLPCTYVATCDVGRGLFAAEPIGAGVQILEFRGPELTLSEARARGDAANALQIGVDRYLYLDEPGRFINHSCAPNAAVIDDTRLCALRDIAAGEEIRFDYSTTVSDGWTMSCRCGAPGCRDIVVAFQLLPVPLRQHYAIRRFVQRFIVDQVGA
jgi:uncharacterized protein